MFIALAQINSQVANFRENTNRIITCIDKIQAESKPKEKKHPTIIIFPEGALSGYPWHDLVEADFLFNNISSCLKEIQSKLKKHTYLILGSIIPQSQLNNLYFKCSRKRNIKNLNLSSLKTIIKGYINAAIVLTSNDIKIFPKTILPTYDVFNEDRWFIPGNIKNNIIKIHNKSFLITICEDIWGWNYKKNPLISINDKIDYIINISGSPFTINKYQERLNIIKKTALHFNSFIIYCNRIGAEDELIFDGRSMIVGSKGNIEWELPSFTENLYLFEIKKNKFIHRLKYQDFFLNTQKSNINLNNNLNESLNNKKGMKKTNVQLIQQALILGIRDFAKKNGFNKAHIGISGGIDSALVLCLAAEALNPESITAIMLPTRFSSYLSFSLAEKLCKNLNVHYKIFDIENIFQAFSSQIDQNFSLKDFGVVHENLQSRIRSIILMSYSNVYNSLLLGTSNKSELATGYSTLYGDLVGGLLPIGDLYKTQVYELANIYKSQGILPKELITRKPTAELRKNQFDEDHLLPYKKLDQYLFQLIEHGTFSLNNEESHNIFKWFKYSEFKRWQSPPILKISFRSFGRGRHWPIGYKNSI